jgi:hypothetical protein
VSAVLQLIGSVILTAAIIVGGFLLLKGLWMGLSGIADSVAGLDDYD